MSISVRTLYEDISSDQGGLSSPTHQQRVIRAINKALSQMSLAADLATRISLVDDLDDSIDLDAEYEYIVFDGLRFHIVRMGSRPADPRIARVVLEDTDKQWKSSLFAYVVAESNDATETMGLDRDP